MKKFEIKKFLHYCVMIKIYIEGFAEQQLMTKNSISSVFQEHLKLKFQTKSFSINNYSWKTFEMTKFAISLSYKKRFLAIISEKLIF